MEDPLQTTRQGGVPRPGLSRPGPSRPGLSRPGLWTEWHAEETPLRLGVSSCLLGQEVRYDGGHARDRFVTDVLATWLEFVPVCPEAEMGLGVPRPTIRLERHGEAVRLVEPRSGEDLTERMEAFAARRVAALREEDLDGYVLKKNSPSCGLERLKIHTNGQSEKNGRGLFAKALVEGWPGLPVEEEGRLNDPHLRENFIERVFARNRWRALVRGGLSRGRLVEFHTAHKLLLRSHQEEGYRELGRLVGSAGNLDDAELFRRYEEGFQALLAVRAKRAAHVNVLQHAMGYLKTLLDSREKALILSSIDDFRAGLVPLVVPLSLLRFNIAKHDVEYLRGQLYFDPHPKELCLRNHC